jgi:hypothetical protein
VREISASVGLSDREMQRTPPPPAVVHGRLGILQPDHLHHRPRLWWLARARNSIRLSCLGVMKITGCTETHTPPAKSQEEPARTCSFVGRLPLPSPEVAPAPLSRRIFTMLAMICPKLPEASRMHVSVTRYARFCEMRPSSNSSSGVGSVRHVSSRPISCARTMHTQASGPPPLLPAFPLVFAAAAAPLRFCFPVALFSMGRVFCG